MKKKDLQKFCFEGEGRDKIKTPWTDEGYTYATNGHICIKVPALSDVPAEPYPVDAEKVFRETPQPTEWFTVPHLAKPKTPEEIVCTDCEGTGKDDLNECPECGHKKDCPDCDGTGKVKEDIAPRYLKIGNQSFDEKYLYLIQGFPNVRIGPATGLIAARIKFDGGEGLLMPGRKHDSHLRLVQKGPGRKGTPG